MDETPVYLAYGGPICGLLCCFFVVVVIAGAVFFFLRRKKAAAEAEAPVADEPAAQPFHPPTPSTAPTTPPPASVAPPPLPNAAPAAPPSSAPPPLPASAPRRPPTPDSTMLPPPDLDPGDADAPTTRAGAQTVNPFARSVDLAKLNKPLAAGATIVPDDDWIDQQDGDETVLLPRNGKN